MPVSHNGHGKLPMEAIERRGLDDRDGAQEQGLPGAMAVGAAAARRDREGVVGMSNPEQLRRTPVRLDSNSRTVPDLGQGAPALAMRHIQMEARMRLQRLLGHR